MAKNPKDNTDTVPEAQATQITKPQPEQPELPLGYEGQRDDNGAIVPSRFRLPNGDVRSDN